MRMKMTSLAAAAAFAALSGCSTPTITSETDALRQRADDNSVLLSAGISGGNPVDIRGSAQHVERLAKEQKSSASMRRATRPFISATMVPVTDEDKLPSIFHVNYEMNFSSSMGGGGLSLHQVAARLTKITGVPVRVHADVASSSSGSGGSTGGGISPMPRIGAGGMPSPLLMNQDSARPPSMSSMRSADAVSAAEPISMDGIEMSWSGTIAGFLNHLVDRLGLHWEYRDGTVVIQRYLTEFHEIAALPGAINYSMSSGGGSSGSGGSSGAGSTATSALDVKESGSMDVVTTMEKAVEKMVSSVPGSSVMRAEGSGRLVVKTTREMQAQVRDFIRAENASMMRQAQIQLDIYSVKTDASDERGLDWSVIFKSATGVAQLGINSPSSLVGATAGNVTTQVISGLTNDASARFGDSRLILQALAQKGYAASHRPISLLSLNRQWARKSQLNTQGYLAETTPGVASSTGVGVPGLKTSTFTTGDQYVALPQILDDNSVLLKFGVSLSDLVNLFDVTVGSGNSAQKVQTPEISAVSDQYTVALKSGEVMVLAGFSRLVANTDQRTLAESVSVGLGGSRKSSMKREHFVILVRPVIL